jgi:hypothetical protein
MACQSVHSEQVVQEVEAGSVQHRIKNYKFYSTDPTLQKIPPFLFYFHRYFLFEIMAPNQMNPLGCKNEYSSHKTKPRGFSPPANYTDRATATCRRS